MLIVHGDLASLTGKLSPRLSTFQGMSLYIACVLFIRKETIIHVSLRNIMCFIQTLPLLIDIEYTEKSAEWC